MEVCITRVLILELASIWDWYNQWFIPGTFLHRRRVISGFRVLLLPRDQRDVSFLCRISFYLEYLRFVFFLIIFFFLFFSLSFFSLPIIIFFPFLWCLLPLIVCTYFLCFKFLFPAFLSPSPIFQPFLVAFLVLVLLFGIFARVLVWVFALLV